MEQHDRERAKEEVLRLLAAVPLGSLTTVGDLASAAGLAQPHVEAILSRLDREERAIAPWHRVVQASGLLAATTSAREQARLLSFEGVAVEGGRVPAFEARRHRHR